MAVSPLSLIRGIKYTSIDFGHNSIKYLNSRVKNGEFKLLASGRREIPTGTIKEGEIIDNHLLTKIISDIFDEKNMEPGILMITPASGQEFVRNIKLPKMPQEELKEALIWEVQDFLDLDVEEIALDYVITDETGDQYELLVAGISKFVLNGYLDIFNDNMLDVKVFNLDDMALISLLDKEKNIEKPSLILDIGASRSKILIATKNKLFLSREVDISGNNFTELFLKENVKYEEAEIKKKKFEFFPNQAGEENIDLMLSGIDTAETLQKKVKDLADEIIFEVNRSLEYHNERNSGNLVDKVYLTGGGLLLNGLVDYFREEIYNEIFILDPFKKNQIKEKSNQINKNFLAVAAGTVFSEVIYNEG
jgi:type IV pilus assembly protein PilM